jgi:hypothetical protein
MNMEPVTSANVDLDWTAGDTASIRRLAAMLSRPRVEETLRAIHAHLQPILIPSPVAYDHPARRKMTSTEILRVGAWGCSAHAQVACHLARGCGIPAILVKSLDVAWIERENRGDGRASGHVYVEVLVDGYACLWDAEGGVLHRNYDPRSTVTPDAPRVIYDKGGPDALVLSHHGPVWEDETRRLMLEGRLRP